MVSVASNFNYIFYYTVFLSKADEAKPITPETDPSEESFNYQPESSATSEDLVPDNASTELDILKRKCNKWT